MQENLALNKTFNLNTERELKRSPIFYMGNKYKLLKQLIPLFPKSCDVFVDAFGGSGVVSINYQGKNKTIYNEVNTNVVELFNLFKNNKPEELNEYFTKRIDEFKIMHLGKDYKEHMELQKGYYDFREYYNKCENKNLKDLYLLSCYSMNHLLRFNKKQEFNVSCGSTQKYQYKYIEDAYDNMQNIEVLNKNIFNLELDKLTNEDFVYLDPPYLNTTAVYNEKREWGGWDIDDDLKLFDLLEELNNKGIKWGLSNVFVNRNKVNQHLIEWCDKNNWNVYHLNRNYNPFSRGNSNNDEVYICNYS